MKNIEDKEDSIWVHLPKVHHCQYTASLAQWQSTGLVNQGSWVQFSQEARKIYVRIFQYFSLNAWNFHEIAKKWFCAQRGARTHDPEIKSLSHIGLSARLQCGGAATLGLFLTLVNGTFYVHTKTRKRHLGKQVRNIKYQSIGLPNSH